MDALTRMARQTKTHAPSVKQCHLEYRDNPRDRTIVSIMGVRRHWQAKRDEEALNPADRETMEVPRGLT